MKTNGFTLIELLIVIVIISIVTSVATLTIHFNRNKQREAWAHTLANQITLAEEEALLRSVVLGMALTEKDVRFYVYQEKNHAWELLTHKTFRALALPDHTKITFTVQDRLIPADGKPHFIISSSGDIPAFVISIGKPDEKPLYQVIGEANGKVYAE